MALTVLMMATLLSGAAAHRRSKIQIDENMANKIQSFFESLDHNSDGWVSWTESYAAFDNFDTNKDGIWTLTEFSNTPKGSQMPKDEAERRFNFYDRFDGKMDGKVQRSGIEQFHRMTDIDGDGKLSKGEVIDFFVANIGPLVRGS